MTKHPRIPFEEKKEEQQLFSVKSSQHQCQNLENQRKYIWSQHQLKDNKKNEVFLRFGEKNITPSQYKIKIEKKMRSNN